MRRIILLVAILFSSLAAYSQDHTEPERAYQSMVSVWNPNSNKYEGSQTAQCDIMIFFLNDRIKIKDLKNSVYYTRGERCRL